MFDAIRPQPPPSFLSDGDLEASKAGGFSLNGGQMESQQNLAGGNTYSPFGNYSMNFNSPTQNTAAPKAGTMNPALAKVASSYSPFFMKF